MAGLERQTITAVLSVIVITQLPVSQGADECPTGFQLAAFGSTDKYCYSLKNPEQFSDKFVNCTSNLSTFLKITSSSLPKLSKNVQIWTDYKTLYPGSIFTDHSYTSSTGGLLETTYEVKRSDEVNIDDELCVVMEQDYSLSMVKCDERYARYCIVEAGAEFETHKLEHVKLTVTVDSGNKIRLTVDYATPRKDEDPKLSEDDIICFTDSSRYYPYKVSIDPYDLGETSESDIYTITALESGYYWCIHLGFNDFYISESNKTLYIESTENLLNVYAVKIKSFDRYSLDNAKITKLRDDWKKNIEEYLFYSTEYSKVNTGSFDNITIMNFKNNHPELNYEKRNIIKKICIKRLYLDAKTVLLHVEVIPGVPPVKPGQWEGILVEYMRPVYYCDKENKFYLDMSYSTADCELYLCAGDYSVGVQTNIVPLDGCTMPPPQKRLDTVIDKMKILANSTDPVDNNDINEVFNQVDKIIVLQGLNITGIFLSLLDDIGTKIDVHESNVTIVGKNIALLVAYTQPEAPIQGLRLLTTTNDTFTNDTFSFVTDVNSDLLSAAKTEVFVVLPNSVSSSKRRISFLVFRDDYAFQGGRKQDSVNSRVISVKVENLTKFSPGEMIDIYLKPFRRKRNEKRTCAFWQFNNDNVTGSWSQEGCSLIRAPQAGLLDTCRCNHLTHFAEIFVPHSMLSKTHEVTLERITIIGCCVSIFGLLFVGVTAIFFSSWRREFRNKVWLQLCISILILSVCFLTKVFAEFDEIDIFCPLTGIALHYSVLSSYCWMLVAAIVSYRQLVAVFSQDPTYKFLRAASFAWGVPCAVVIIVLSVAPNSYAGDFEDMSPSGAFCYPSGLALWLAVYVPITLMLLSNCSLFVLILRSVFGNKRPRNHKESDAKEAFRFAWISSFLVFLFGLPWFLGLLSSSIICDYLFTIFGSFQGFVLFFFIVLGNKNTRDLWLIHLKIQQPKNSIMTMSNTNKSR